MKLLLFALIGALAQALPAATQPLAVASPAIDGILAAFETHPLVAVGDVHCTAQEFDFWNALVRDPRFAKQVGNVVVEFGGAAHQDTIDRYMNGGDVSYADFRKIMSDTVGWNPTVFCLGYPAFFAQVRTVNMSLPPAQRIHVWLGEPVIDWTKIKTRADYDPISAIRDSHAAEVIVQNILAKKRKALILYGGGHFDATRRRVPKAAPQPGSEVATRKWIVDLTRGAPDYGEMSSSFATVVKNQAASLQAQFVKLGVLQSMAFNDHDPPGQDGFDAKFANGGLHIALAIDKDGKIAGAALSSLPESLSLADLIDTKQPGALYIVQLYTGMSDKACTQRYAPIAATWPMPGLVAPDPRTNLAPPVAGCGPRGLTGDALLYLGPADRLVFGASLPDLYLDLDFRKELARRMAILGRGELGYDQPPKMESFPQTPFPVAP